MAFSSFSSKMVLLGGCILSISFITLNLHRSLSTPSSSSTSCKICILDYHPIPFSSKVIFSFFILHCVQLLCLWDALQNTGFWKGITCLGLYSCNTAVFWEAQHEYTHGCSTVLYENRTKLKQELKNPTEQSIQYIKWFSSSPATVMPLFNTSALDSSSGNRASQKPCHQFENVSRKW